MRMVRKSIIALWLTNNILDLVKDKIRIGCVTVK